MCHIFGGSTVTYRFFDLQHLFQVVRAAFCLKFLKSFCLLSIVYFDAAKSGNEKSSKGIFLPTDNQWKPVEVFTGAHYQTDRLRVLLWPYMSIPTSVH
jgi:hypothetical protein